MKGVAPNGAIPYSFVIVCITKIPLLTELL